MSFETASFADTPSGVGELRALGAELRRVAARYLAAARACSDDEAALDGVVDCERVVSAVHAARVHLLDSLVRGGEDLRACEFVPDEVAPVLGWSTDRSRLRFGDAVALKRRLPDVLTALENGRLDLHEATLFADKTHARDQGQCAEVVGRVLGSVEGRTAASLARSLRRAVVRVDPGGSERRHQVEKAKRRIVVYRLDDGMAELRAYLAADAAMAVYGLVDAVARGSRVPDDQRSMDARRADAFVDLALGRRDPGTSSLPDHGFRPLLQVTVAATTLLGLDDKPGELEGYGPVTADFARRLARDQSGRWRRFITDPRGRLVAIGTTYRPPPSLDTFVRARDRRCLRPGCERAARYGDVDHTAPWPDGPTTADNLRVLCRRHHREKTQRRTRVQQRDGTFHWTVHGRQYTWNPRTTTRPRIRWRGAP